MYLVIHILKVETEVARLRKLDFVKVTREKLRLVGEENPIEE